MSPQIFRSPLIFDLFCFALILSVLGYSTYFSLYVPPVILEQGLSHRIFYFHVPVAWVALYGPLFSAIFSILYLWKKDMVFDTLSFSLNQISLLFAIGVLFSGPIWALSAWGVAWDETDARLQSFFVLCLTLVAYFVFRFVIPSRTKRASLSSFLSILCALTAVMTWGAIRWIENPGNHPGSVLGKGGMEPIMKQAFWLGVIAYHLLFLGILYLLVRFQFLLAKTEQFKFENENA